ncbi:DinB family protein [Shivajiella indica]|uniref:DinB family protein n=1 Tax=Shivajiella indica TaxID=872115 RepID=A0ABW5B650_9BACT
MADPIKLLLNDIKLSRTHIIELIKDIDKDGGSLKLSKDHWNIQEIIEHLVLAERGGFDLIFTAAENFRNGTPIWSGPSENTGQTIEEIIHRTWKEKETAPPSATPQGKWSLGVWTSHFKNCDDLLLNLIPVLKDLPLEEVIYPHFLCGPLNAIQRLEFIRFHIDRHFHQISNLKKDLGI